VRSVETRWQGEPRWPAALAVIAIAVLYYSLPERLTPGPTWVTVTVILVALGLTILSHRAGRHNMNHILGIAVLVLITGALFWSLGLLIAGLPGKRQPPLELLRSAGALWISNVLAFASWYWRLDGGGPNCRDRQERHENGAFLFPQMTLSETADWKPGFVDYLFLAFNTSTAFSPTDTPVLSGWAKLLMMLQSTISLGSIAILAARAINIL
jgi:hypothetical protein